MEILAFLALLLYCFSVNTLVPDTTETLSFNSVVFDFLNRQKSATNKDQGELLSLQSHYLRFVWFEWIWVTSKLYELWQGRKRLKVPTWFHSQITEELESVKAQMDERGTNMTDAGKILWNRSSFQIATA